MRCLWDLLTGTSRCSICSKGMLNQSPHNYLRSPVAQTSRNRSCNNVSTSTTCKLLRPASYKVVAPGKASWGSLKHTGPSGKYQTGGLHNWKHGPGEVCFFGRDRLTYQHASLICGLRSMARTESGLVEPKQDHCCLKS